MYFDESVARNIGKRQVPLMDTVMCDLDSYFTVKYLLNGHVRISMLTKDHSNIVTDSTKLPELVLGT